MIESPGSLILVDDERIFALGASLYTKLGEAQIINLMQKVEAELEVSLKDPHKYLPKELVYSLNHTVVVIVPDYIEITVENSATGGSITLKIEKEKRLTNLAQEILPGGPACKR